MKKLSYIIPLYNSARWIEKCLYSVLNQDIPETEVEIICVNDGSPDNSADIAREIGKCHDCITVTDQSNMGASGARNTGMRKATGKYLCFVDPDDYVEANVYGSLVRRMEEEQLDMLRFDYQIVDEEYRILPKSGYEQKFDLSERQMSGAEFIATRLDIGCNIWRYIYRREIITENEIWCFTGDYYDDTPWLPLVLLQAKRMNICDTVVYNYLERSDSLVKSRSAKMMKRKSDGVILLLKYLEQELSDIKSGKIAVDKEWKEGVARWYKRMEAHSVVSLLTDIGTALYDERRDYVRQLRELQVFPLTADGSSGNGRRKIKTANISPMLLIGLIHIKNKKR